MEGIILLLTNHLYLVHILFFDFRLHLHNNFQFSMLFFFIVALPFLKLIEMQFKCVIVFLVKQHVVKMLFMFFNPFLLFLCPNFQNFFLYFFTVIFLNSMSGITALWYDFTFSCDRGKFCVHC